MPTSLPPAAALPTTTSSTVCCGYLIQSFHPISRWRRAGNSFPVERTQRKSQWRHKLCRLTNEQSRGVSKILLLAFSNGWKTSWHCRKYRKYYMSKIGLYDIEDIYRLYIYVLKAGFANRYVYRYANQLPCVNVTTIGWHTGLHTSRSV